MTDAPAEPDIHLTLRPLPDTVPIAVRLRRLLKFALRVCRLKCVKIDWQLLPEETPGEDES